MLRQWATWFGKWAKDEWIEKVFAAAHGSPEWEYLLLTKFPQRYVGLDLPSTAWIGTTVDDQYRVKIAEEAFRKIHGVRVKWLSLEPLLAPLEFSDLSMFDFVVIGSQSATEQPAPVGHVPEFAPPFEWVARLTAQAREAGCRIYHKPNSARRHRPAARRDETHSGGAAIIADEGPSDGAREQLVRQRRPRHEAGPGACGAPKRPRPKRRRERDDKRQSAVRLDRGYPRGYKPPCLLFDERRGSTLSSAASPIRKRRRA